MAMQPLPWSLGRLPIYTTRMKNMFFIAIWQRLMKWYMWNAQISSEERVSIKSELSSYGCTLMSSWNCVLRTVFHPLKKKKNSSRKRKQTRNDLIMITPATPKSRRSSEKQNSFPSAMNWAAPVIKILIRRQKAWCLCCGLWGQSYLPGLRQEWLKYNPPHCWMRSGVPAKPVFQNALAFVSEDAYGCKNIEKELFIIYMWR